MEIFILAFIFAFIPALVAASRGRSAGAYFVGGLLCWPIALVIVLCKPNLKLERAKEELRREEQRRHEQLIAALIGNRKVAETTGLNAVAEALLPPVPGYSSWAYKG